MTDRAADPLSAGPEAGGLDTAPAGPTLVDGVVEPASAGDGPGFSGAGVSQGTSRRRRYRGPVSAARLRARLLLRRWRQSLQFRAVSIALIGALIVFLVTGSFLSHQISERLFNDSLQQALSQSEADYRQVQASFEASDAGDREQLQTLVSSTLSGLDTGSSAESRRWVLIPISPSDGQIRSTVPAQSEDSWLTPEAVPQELQRQVAEAPGGGQFWQSSSLPLEEGGAAVPVVVVGQVVEPEDGSQYGLYFIHDFAQPQRTLDAMHAVLVLATLVQTLLVSGVVWYVTREVVRPVSYTARVSESLADGNLGVRMEVRGSHEVARLGRSFNRMADNLQDQITRLERLSSMQQTFVSDVSHELRTPLTTVRMAAEVLHNARDDFDPVNRRSAELLYHQVDRFDVLLADLLEISRFDAGAARLEITGVNILYQITGVLESAAMLAANSGTVIRVHSSTQRILVQMDQRRIERILRNLVVNAIEHGEGRPIDIVVGASETTVAVAVRDHGIGMTQEQTAKVFNRFWRADPARARTTGGTGLGLSISAEDTRLHGGWLDAWGSPGAGACFRLTLPLLQSHHLSEDDVSPVELPPEEEALPVTGVVTDTGTMVVLPLDRDSVVARSTGQLQLADIRAARAPDDAQAQVEQAQVEQEQNEQEHDGQAQDGEPTTAPADAAVVANRAATTAPAPDGAPHGDGDDSAATIGSPGEPGGAVPDGDRQAIGGAFLSPEPSPGTTRFLPTAQLPVPPTAEDAGGTGEIGETAAPEGFVDPAASGVSGAPADPPAPEHEEDDLDVSYEDLFPDDTGELPAFRDLEVRGPQGQTPEPDDDPPPDPPSDPSSDPPKEPRP